MNRNWNNIKIVPKDSHLEVFNADNKFLFSADNMEEVYTEVNSHILH